MKTTNLSRLFGFPCGFGRRVIPALIAGMCVYSLMSCMTAPPRKDRPKEWAQPVQLYDVENLYKVSEDLYRSKQPAREGFYNLPCIGVRTIINLRRWHSDENRLKKLPFAFKLVDIPGTAWGLSENDVVKFLSVFFKNPNSEGSVLVHCQAGSDRTGTMVAAYRIIYQDWTKCQAIDEMVYGGYGFHLYWHRLIRFIMGMDVRRIKERLRQEIPDWRAFKQLREDKKNP